MKKVMLKRPKGKEMLSAVMISGGIYYAAYATTGSVALGFVWLAIAALAGCLGIVAMKVYGTY
jgi:hypothetical protein